MNKTIYYNEKQALPKIWQGMQATKVFKRKQRNAELTKLF